MIPEERKYRLLPLNWTHQSTAGHEQDSRKGDRKVKYPYEQFQGINNTENEAHEKSTGRHPTARFIPYRKKLQDQSRNDCLIAEHQKQAYHQEQFLP